MADKDFGEVILKDVRLSFAHIFEPQEPKKNTKTGEMMGGGFQASFLMDRESDTHEANMAKIKKVAAEVKKDKWHTKPPKLKPHQVCLRNGDLEDWDGYEGCDYVKTNRATKDGPPVIVGRDRETVSQGEKGAPYAGCFVNAVIRVWAQDNEHGKRLNASLEAVQYLRKGDGFGAAPVDPNEKFQKYDEDEEDLRPIGDDDEDGGDDTGLI